MKVVDVGVGSEASSPGDVAMTCRIKLVAAFAKEPAARVTGFAKGEEIGSDVVMRGREAFLDGGELVHEGEADVVLFGAKVDGLERPWETAARFPADLAAQAGGIAAGFDGAEAIEEAVESVLDEMPVIGAAGEEGSEPEIVVLDFVNVDGGEIAVATGGDVETEAVLGFGFEEFAEVVIDEALDIGATTELVFGIELAELFLDVVVLHMEAKNVVIVTAALDHGPFDDGSA